MIHVTSISLNKSSLRLQAGANAILAASISPVNADNKQVTWSSSDTGIATVEDGVVTGVKPGVVKITADRRWRIYRCLRGDGNGDGYS